jgi:hypothetical protein
MKEKTKIIWKKIFPEKNQLWIKYSKDQKIKVNPFYTRLHKEVHSYLRFSFCTRSQQCTLM